MTTSETIREQIEDFQEPRIHFPPRTEKPDAKRRGIQISRMNTTPGVDPLDVEWEMRDAVIRAADGRAVFEQRGVWFPKAWSQQATDVVAQKYFRGKLGSPTRESSVRTMILRVVDAIRDWGLQHGHFATRDQADIHRDELIHLLVHQKFAFNSPVWFNVGVEPQPQCSACFINSVHDDVESIMALARTEVSLFKYGSGAGSNLSEIRASCEHLSGGGNASGPVSFMRGFDAFAGAIKSGGKTRRAAKMVILDADHPDVVEFVRCKAREEAKAHALVDAGYDGSFDAHGGAYDSIQYQNANHSVRVTDEFMVAATSGGRWQMRARTDGRVTAEVAATDLLDEIARAAWACGDPGMQFDSAINTMHTCPAGGRIRASNPCSEYMFLDDSACNLGSLNLRAFQGPLGEIDVDRLRHATRVAIVAMEILVSGSSYPTAAIAENSRRYRPLGLGYANLGALLMSRGMAYDSDAGRALAASVTALIAGEAYLTSAVMARAIGPFEAYPENRSAFLDVVGVHQRAIDRLQCTVGPADRALVDAAYDAWRDAAAVGAEHGFRNAQGTVLAPTGTIAFIMDCDTTGVEPELALVKSKRLVGGGTMRIVNRTVPDALHRLGYDGRAATEILRHVTERGTVEGCSALRAEHLAVFDCALPVPGGTRSIHHLGHLRMMGAVQPFLSGAISKTVNLPADCTAADVRDVLVAAWQMGLKSIAVYRDGCKRTQPLSTSASASASTPAPTQIITATTGQVSGEEETLAKRWDAIVSREPLVPPNDGALVLLSPDERRMVEGARSSVARPAGPPVALRHRLDDERLAVVHKFSVAGHEGYLTLGMYEDGSLGEIFVRMAKEGSAIAGLMDSFATAISLALQHGVPPRVLIEKFRGTRFEPAGFTGNKEIPIATSIMDYLVRWIELYLSRPGRATRPAGPADRASPASESMPADPPRAGADLDEGNAARVSVRVRASRLGTGPDSDAPICPECGSLMERSGACHRCPNCGSTSGCS